MSLQLSSSGLNRVDSSCSSSTASSGSDELQVLPLGYQIDASTVCPGTTTANIVNSPHATVGTNLHIVLGDNANLYVGDGSRTLHDQANYAAALRLTPGSPRSSSPESGANEAQPPRKAAIRSKIVYVPLILVFSVSLIIIGVVVWAQTERTEETTTTEETEVPTSTTPVVTTEVPDYDGFYIPREVWGGADPTSPSIKAEPAMLFVIKHTAGETCTNQKQCSKVVREIQKEHMEVLGFADISYNFLVGGDGKIYNGRGWGVQNEGRNDSLDVAFMGNFNVDDPTTKMMNAALRIQITGQSAGQVKYGKYRVMNHNQTEPTDSPGKRLFAKTISNLNYYSGAVCYHNASGQVVIDYDCP
ncbi:hypothetical protein HUJ04_008756 [Dendroctonus ponderosae]|nr:hypothetical protein HUJ04_008756 [Dendroctonus ponderosae]